mgnify:CR=1 FL=1
MKLILASSSPYRKSLLEKLGLEFTCISPNVDEASVANETPQELAARLSIAKARAIARNHSDALIIGSDQVAWLDGCQLHKPGTRAANIEQLTLCSAKTAYFYTALSLLNSQTGELQTSVESYQTTFRKLSNEKIACYVDKEKAYDCAGGFKMEGLGIALFENISGDDPNILIGLPLIKLVSMLQNQGIDVLSTGAA